MKRLDMKVITVSKATVCCTDKLAVMKNFKELLPNEPKNYIVEGMFFGIVTNGSLNFMLDKQPHDLSAGDIFTCYPRNILEKYIFSDDIEGVAVFISSDHLEEFYDKLNIDWSMRLISMSHEPLHATPSEAQRIIDYIELLADKMRDFAGPFRNECISSLLKSMALNVFDLRLRSYRTNARPSMKYTSAERLFYDFVKMLNDPHMPYINVNGYAEKLNISPKYFSTICRQLTGKTAGQLINEELIRSAKILLHDREKSIKQVSDELNFANQSHFASFFHRHVGMSPQRFRARML